MGVEQRFFCDMFIIAESLRPVSFRWKEFELLLFFSNENAKRVKMTRTELKG